MKCIELLEFSSIVWLMTLANMMIDKGFIQSPFASQHSTMQNEYCGACENSIESYYLCHFIYLVFVVLHVG